MLSKSKIPPQFGVALGEIVQVVADGIDAFCFHGVFGLCLKCGFYQYHSATTANSFSRHCLEY
ncbi:protein of unknown function [Georgfuchsia toluolica]|uniref:Uncharacterized protein n=1 Tax=Georgfuchsia toluolica TaxID=424218 RepID=A0A916J3A8_9PROT|nr:protein of unknown function [Georgfuchsia toluolica]